MRDGDILRGVEAVIDKDLSAALLAQRLGADALLLLTDELRSLDLPAGSMRPKAAEALDRRAGTLVSAPVHVCRL